MDVLFALNAEMKAEIDQRILFADGAPLLVEGNVRTALVADIKQHRGHAAACRRSGLGAHILVVGVIDAEMAMRIDNARHQHAPFRIDHPLGVGQRIVGAGDGDPAVVDRNAALKRTLMVHHAGVADHQINLHHCTP